MNKESKIEKVDLIEQESKDIYKDIESIERLIAIQNVPINGTKISKMTNDSYAELSKQADERIRQSNIVSSEDQKQMKLTRFK